MKIIRWLLSHIFLILLIVVVIYGYMFWGNLAGQDTPAGKAIAYLSHEFVEVEEFVNAIKAKQGKSSAKQSTGDGKEGSDNTEKSDVLADKGASEDVSDASRNIEQEPVTISYSHNQMQVKQNSAGDTLAVEIDSGTESASNSMEETPVDAEEALLTDSQGKSVADNAQLAATNAGVDVADSKNGALVGSDAGDISAVETDSGAVSALTSMKESVGVADSKSGDLVSPDTGDISTVVTDRRAVSASTSMDGLSKSVTDNAQSAVTNIRAGVANSKNETFVSPDIEQQLDSVDEHGKVLDEKQQRALVKADWIAARKAFYHRDYELSEKKYLQVIDSTEDNYDAYGELGNIYFNQGKGAQAAAAYFEAAAIFVRTGQVTRARSLVGLLQHLDKTKAVELQKLIQSATS